MQNESRRSGLWVSCSIFAYHRNGKNKKENDETDKPPIVSSQKIKG